MELSGISKHPHYSAPHQVFLPGCFVVLQGIPGDGLANTIDTSPSYVWQDDDDDDDEGGQGVLREMGEVPSLEEDHFRPNTTGLNSRVQTTGAASEAAVSSEQLRSADNNPMTTGQPTQQQQQQPTAQSSSTSSRPIVSSMQGGGLIWSQMVAAGQHTCVLNNPTAPGVPSNAAASSVRGDQTPPAFPEDSFVVISSEPNSPTRIRLYARPNVANSGRGGRSHSRRKERAIQQWNEDGWHRQRRQRREWKMQQQQQQFIQEQPTQHNNPNATRPPQNIPAHDNSTRQLPSAEDDWWLDPVTGYLAIFEDLPKLSKHSVITGKKIGHLPPGSTVVATKLYTLDSETLQIINVDGQQNDKGGGEMNQKPLKSPEPPLAPEIGCIQVLRLQITKADEVAQQEQSGDASSNEETRQQQQQNSCIGYCVYSVHGYAFLVPGIPTMYMDPQVWWWRVTCRVGAFLRQGLELSSDHHCTIPYGAFVQVTRKTVNRMGLSRLRVIAHYEGKNVEGWCSEFLNPLSGQRGHVVQPLPFPVPALYRVALPEGAIIREQVELSSRQIGHAPHGTMLTISQRQFSEHPQEQCVERLKLAGSRSGWISVRLNQLPPQDKCVVELVGVDSRFDPNHPGEFHWQVLSDEHLREQEEGGRRRGASSTGDISSIDDGSRSGSSEEHNHNFMDVVTRSTSNKPSTATYHTEKTSLRQKAKQMETCLICLTEERNATIVHGETGHIACCLVCARILKARGDKVSRDLTSTY
jgi:hypothetical protein